MPRHPSSLLAAVLGAVAVVLLGAAPVPSPVHVQPGAAPDGIVAWEPAVQHVTGTVGEPVAVDLALDHGGDHELLAHVAARAVSVDPVDGPRATGRTGALRLAVDRIALRPGERGAFRAVAEIPARPTVVAVQARLDEDASTGPLALVLLAPEGLEPADLRATIALDGARAQVRVENASPFPVLVDLAVSSGTWLGARDDRQVGDVLVPAEGHRQLDVELSRGLGRRSAEVAVAQRGAAAEATTRATATAWPPRTVWTLVGAALVLLAALTAVRVLRRS
ncbi:MAG: hypothetical protein KY457_14520 [Actinobacteria bacterium]|nr:hypothetical protein [Actinomycetota bacterium]